MFEKYSRRALLSRAAQTALLLGKTGTAQRSAQQTKTWSVTSDNFTFSWSFGDDRAALQAAGIKTPIWTGGLLPAFLFAKADGRVAYVKTAVDIERSSINDSGGKLALVVGNVGFGELTFERRDYGIAITRLLIQWASEPHPIIGLYFGTADLSDDERLASPTLEQSFWPNWASFGFCVPGAKGAPLQSIFRNWDLGSATLPLGSFGPSLGTPYAAAFPRPLYAAAMGNQDGWLCIGTGDAIDGALTLTIQSSSACLHVLYREDLWGAPEAKGRLWKEPLRLSWASDPWEAYRKLFSSFDSGALARSSPLPPQWNTWGDFRKGFYDLRVLADWTKSTGAGILGLDDRWESFTGSGEPSLERFPNFDDDVHYIGEKGLKLGFWQPVGWVDYPEKVGLSAADLIVGKDGVPRRVSWNNDPRSPGHFCLDPSSANTVQFLRRRTINLMQKYRPALLKLDFGYGLPSPNVGVPRDPSLRGERFSLRLIEIIADAARSIDRDVAIEYYSVHPLVRSIADVIAIDDLGDAGSEEALGHRQWSIWSALGATRSNIMASSGYDWNADADSVLDSAVIGTPGAVLSRTMEDGSPVPSLYLNRRIALNRWYRRTTDWTPLWLNTSPGGVRAGGQPRDPLMRSLGRMERLNGEDRLTALVLRDESPVSDLVLKALRGMTWHGSWALIAQDDEDIFRSRLLACLPVSGTQLRIPRASRPGRVAVVTHAGETKWSNWTWANGMLVLRGGNPPDELLGFLIST